jgi:AcrR family transcriptional regulator
MATAAKASKKKRRFVERPDVRVTLLDAAEALILEEGYAAATARAVANRAGLKHQVVFYYFGSQDDLLLALYKRTAGAQRERLAQALSSSQPLSAMWKAIRHSDMARLTMEFMALANHNELIRAEIASDAEALRDMEARAISAHLQKRGIEPRLSPQFVSLLSNSMARLLVQEETLGIHTGHDEAEALINASFGAFESAGEVSEEMEAIVAAMSLRQG